MTAIQKHKSSRCGRKLWHLLPTAILNLFTPAHKETLNSYELTLRNDYYNTGAGDRLAFFMVLAMDQDGFKELIHAQIDKAGLTGAETFKKNYRKFARIIMLHAAAPAKCLPVSRPVLDKWTGDHTSVFRWIMLQHGWLKPSGWKNHFTLSPTSQGLAEAIIKHCERCYSEFFVGQVELKKERSGEDVF